jgi:8-oxo-dGTP diphosphatase
MLQFSSREWIMEINQPWFAVDCVVFDAADRLLLIRRKNPPFQGQYALPGGFIEYGETTEQAAARELAEETNLTPVKLTLVGVYSDPSRDPRRHVVSIAYLARVEGYDLRAGDDAAHAEFVEDWQNKTLAFDHQKIISDARAFLKK